MDRDTPTFNLKAVVQETGIKPDTLRAWERRYGLPEPDRSPGGHRLYSQRDIDTLLWLMARQEEGLTISRAVDLWRSIEDEGRDPLRVSQYALHRSQAPTIQGEEVQTICQRWVKACLEYDEREAERILAQAFAVYPVEAVCTDVLQKGLQIIGEGWYTGDVSVQQEHFASALAMRRIDALMGATPPATRSGRILIACPPGEEHVLGQALLQLFLRRRGWETIYLGANVPLERLETSIEIVRPHLVILTAQQLVTAASLQEMAQVLQDGDVPVAYGGRIFTENPSLRKRLPGHYLGDTLRDALDKVETLIPAPPSLSAPAPMQAETRQALANFQDQALEIHARVRTMMREENVVPPLGANIDTRMMQNIIAALKLGDVSLMDEEIIWVKGMLTHHNFSPDDLATYLTIYHEATRQSLPEKNGPLLDWLSGISERLKQDKLHHRSNGSGGENNAGGSRNGYQS